MDNLNRNEEETSINAKEVELREREIAIASKEDALNSREEGLNAQKSEYGRSVAALSERERLLNIRVEYVAHQEIEARNGFPSQFAERFASAISQITAREEAVAEDEKKLNEKSAELASLELQAKNGFQGLFEERFAEFIKQITARETAVGTRESAVISAVAESRQRINAEISKSEAEISENKRRSFDKIHSDIAVERERLYKALDEEISKLREQRIATLQTEIDTQQTRFSDSCAAEFEKIEKTKQAQDQKEKELSELERELGRREMRLDSRESSLDEKNSLIDDKIAERVADVKTQYEQQIADLHQIRDDLVEQLRAKSQELEGVEQFKASLGGKDVAVIKKEFQEKGDEICKLRKEIEKRPSATLQDEHDKLVKEYDALSREAKKLREKQEQSDEASRSLNALRLENQGLKAENVILKDHNVTIESELNRLNTSKDPVDRDNRVKDIELPIVTLTRNNSEQQTGKPINEMNEKEWLSNINSSCAVHGLLFPKRILYAYHTALKTAEWSPVTVLAGVSGTGKSELPRLYSHFGGINFVNVSVQPNWDSQESMLGYFNSIDNRFDAQPLLRFLAQNTKETEKTGDIITGLRKYVSLVLLDEMNLSHVEHYFAEFLSKLEERRSTGRGKEPQIEIKLGAGIPPYLLNLVRNVLWTGTMNQDETTKSLSDKVLDRGIVINFPRPIELKSRQKLKALVENNVVSAKLLYTTWSNWVKRENYFEPNAQGSKLLIEAKNLVEEINRCLSVAGRAVGHRVWQSIEYYILNYPTVISANESCSGLETALNTAFEDQIVQKIMPKLRGIETRGKQKTDCLDKIGAILEDRGFNLTEDFRFACEAGYGQFMWNSAQYIDKDETASKSTAADETAGIISENEQDGGSSEDK